MGIELLRGEEDKIILIIVMIKEKEGSEKKWSLCIEIEDSIGKKMIGMDEIEFKS